MPGKVRFSWQNFPVETQPETKFMNQEIRKVKSRCKWVGTERPVELLIWWDVRALWFTHYHYWNLSDIPQSSCPQGRDLITSLYWVILQNPSVVGTQLRPRPLSAVPVHTHCLFLHWRLRMLRWLIKNYQSEETWSLYDHSLKTCALHDLSLYLLAVN